VDNINVLIIEDEEFDVIRIKNTLKLFKDKINVIDIFSTGLDALSYLKKSKNKCDVIILDYQISGGLFGKELIKEIKNIDDTIQIVIITKMTINQSDPEFANELIKNGAFWFGTKNPTDIEDFIYQPTDFILAIKNGYNKRLLEIEKKKLVRKNEKSQEKLKDIFRDQMKTYQIIGKSSAIKNVNSLIEKYATVDASILITGESGTGKELVARNIYYKSKRRLEKFITINCSAIPADLIESELFGYEKGAFTDAKASKEGLFEQANNGTIFLDEVSELPLIAQAKLLRVLEYGEIDKIGRKSTCKVDVRVIAASNKNVERLVKEGKFREDLFYRLNILKINVPPLRERREDIEVLLNYFISKSCSEYQVDCPKISERALQFIKEYDFPGNVRQLKNFVLRLILTNKSIIDVNEVEDALGVNNELQTNNFSVPFYSTNNIPSLREAERDFKKKFVQFVRKHSKTDSEAAKKLGLDRSNFHRLCKEIGLK